MHEGIIDPGFRTVTVHRPGAEPRLFNVTETLGGFAEMPGFEVAVSKLFE